MARRSAKTNAQLMCGAASAALLLWAGTAQAQVTTKVEIAPQSLASALNEFGVQTGYQVIFAPSLTGAKTTPGVRADGDIELALTRLLDGSGLAWRRDDDTFLIVRADQGPQSGSAAGAGAEVEALIVTAQKREEDIQDVPIAISAFTQEDLTRSQIAGGPDLITQVPNMTFTKTNFSSYSVQLRGIGTQAISATTDPAVAVAFNNTPFIRNRFFEQEFYDLQRVEVLRGPQGTLYGRNATAGVVNIISQKPRFNFEAKASADVSNYSSHRLEGMVNIPLVEDKVALRLAGAWTKRDGYAVNELSDGPIDGRDLWSTRISLRVSPSDRIDANLIWEHFEEDDDRLRSGKQLCNKDVVSQVGNVPITDYYDTSVAGGQSLYFAGVQGSLSQGCERNSLYAKDSFQRPNGLMLPYYAALAAVGLPAALTDPYISIFAPTAEGWDPDVIDATNDQPEDLRVIQSVIDPTYRASSDLGELQVSFDLTDTLTLTSETAYARDVVYSLQDFNRFNTAPGAWLQPNGNMRPGVLQEGPSGGIFCDPQLGCSDRLVAVDISTAEATQFSQEFRIASSYDGPFNFSLGANFLRADSEDKYYVFFNSVSLISALGPSGNNYEAYVPGVTDNVACLQDAYDQRDPAQFYAVVGCQYLDPNPIDQVNDEGHNYFLSKNPYKLISYAVFGETYFNLLEDLKVTAGLRWTVDKKEAPRIPSWTLASQSVGYPIAEVIEQEWREPTGRLTVDWKPDLAFTDETLVYGSYAHGYKAGGANPPRYVITYYSSEGLDVLAAKSATRPRVFDAEFVDAFELGTKNTLMDGSLTLNLAAFYYDYKDYQISEIVDRSAYNRNLDATVWGVELEADWRPFENLRFGFKGGYQDTRIADGEEAIDLMDRTAGDPNWLVVRPFPTYASSCILPTFVFENPDGTLGRVGGAGGGGPTGCEIAYLKGWDPVTDAPYVDLANGGVPEVTGPLQRNNLDSHPGYPGWDPSTAPNGGEGIMKPLGGNQLPNAPNWTGTITADYTVPLPNDWLATLHTDLHWQGESWWRVFNDHEYGKLDEYFTMNLAAIFTNEESGWHIMAYIKNVTDETAITGAFLNSDDTGLTTNIFLTEPRLYGLRVTKAWQGGPLLGGFGQRREGPFPLTVELGGQVQRHDAPNAVAAPSFAPEFQAPFDIVDDPQQADLDWGDGRDVKVTWRPGERWSLSAAMRLGQTNGYGRVDAEQLTDPVCFYSNAALCASFASHPTAWRIGAFSLANNAQATSTDREEHKVFDVAVNYDVPVSRLSRSAFSGGLRRVELQSDTVATLRGIPDRTLPEALLEATGMLTHSLYIGEAEAHRTFEGWGPVVAWEAAYPLLEGADFGRLDLDWSLSGGALIGEREVTVSDSGEELRYELLPFQAAFWEGFAASPIPTRIPTGSSARRSQDATVPTAGLSFGLSYSIGAFSAGAGYRWERYFDAIDGGFESEEGADRTIDGPYFKLSVGFGG